MTSTHSLTRNFVDRLLSVGVQVWGSFGPSLANIQLIYVEFIGAVSAKEYVTTVPLQTKITVENKSRGIPDIVAFLPNPSSVAVPAAPA